MSPRLPILLLFSLTLTATAQRSLTVLPAPPVKIRLDELVISGTTALDSAGLNQITSSLIGQEYSDDSKEMSERLKDAFQQRGYFHPEIKTFNVKALDPLANPKPVRIEAEVNEGIRYRFAAFRFKGNPSFPSERLLAEFPIHPGDDFDVEKIRSGLTALRDLYIRNGYVMMVPVPNTQTGSDGTITLEFDIDEGPKFRMGSVEFTGDRDVIEQLRAQWQIAAGDPFDAAYPEKFANDNKALLPPDFNYMNDVRVGLNCKEAIAQVRVDADPRHPKIPDSKPTGCDSPSNDEKEQKR